MRIISGLFKGAKLIDPKDLNTRPLKDLVKESIFNYILHSKKFSIKFEKLVVLDAFSGTGSFGLECISRGSNDVTFIENYDPAIEVLKQNINKFKLNKFCKVMNINFLNFKILPNCQKKFNLVFLDPPYKLLEIGKVLEIAQQILDSNGLLVLHRHKKSDDSFSGNLDILDTRNYGLSKIQFLKLR